MQQYSGSEDTGGSSSHLEWHTIGQTSNQLILYHPPSHALSVRPHPLEQPVGRRPSKKLLLPYDISIKSSAGICPKCSQPLPIPTAPTGGYFEILERAHEGSRPPSPTLREKSPTPEPYEETPAKGYYERFFREECRLGIGAEGSVYLATHVIGGNVLGTYAVKKIAIGTSKPYLGKMLREVRLLEALRHPNIIPYHHSWIDLTRFSSFGPPIMALHVLMMYATAGNLDTYLIQRSHATEPSNISARGLADAESLGQLPKAERIKAFKTRRMSKGGNSKKEENRGVLLLGLEEVVTLFGDVVEGLAFLHANSILHLDLKCSNVLLHWEEGKLIPKAMISDFGTSEEMLRGKRDRTGHTGTMEYMAPETIVTDAQGCWRPSDSHADMWSLGMILHKLLFLHLPYPNTEDYDALHAAILNYRGFVPTAELVRSCERRHIPRDILVLLAKLIDVVPEARPSAEKVKAGLRAINIQPTRGIGGIVTRFARPLNFLSPSPEPEVTPNWQEVSPVLTLPGPTEGAERLEPEREKGERILRAFLLAIKMLSLQPAVSGISVSPYASILLVISALLAFFISRWDLEGVSVVCHAAVLLRAVHIAVVDTADEAARG